MKVEVRPSTIDGAGDGLFATVPLETQAVVVSEPLIVAPEHIALGGRVWGDVSQAWGLVATLCNARDDGATPEWISELAKNKDLTKHMLDPAENPNDHALANALSRRFKGKPILPLFSACVTNFSCFTIEGTTYTALGRLYSKMNHSDSPNVITALVGTDLSNMMQVVIASRPIAAGEELFIDYGEAYKPWLSSNTQ